MLLAMANWLWKISLTSSREKGGSVGAKVQVMVTEAAEVGVFGMLSVIVPATKGAKRARALSLLNIISFTA